MSEHSMKFLRQKNEFTFVALEPFSVKGKEKPISVYEVQKKSEPNA
jgi:hypothetical protein